MDYYTYSEVVSRVLCGILAGYLLGTTITMMIVGCTMWRRP